jgi:hypothetical protein
MIEWLAQPRIFSEFGERSPSSRCLSIEKTYGLHSMILGHRVQERSDFIDLTAGYYWVAHPNHAQN